MSEDIKWIDRRLGQLGIDVRQSNAIDEMRSYLDLLHVEIDATQRFLAEDCPTMKTSIGHDPRDDPMSPRELRRELHLIRRMVDHGITAIIAISFTTLLLVIFNL
jgi:hypothetical protein